MRFVFSVLSIKVINKIRNSSETKLFLGQPTIMSCKVYKRKFNDTNLTAKIEY